MSVEVQVPAAQASALLRTLWASTQPATLQGPDLKLIDVNEAYCQLVGLSASQLIGTDPLALQPAEDRALNAVERAHLLPLLGPDAALPPMRRRLRDAKGREHWFSLVISNIAEAAQPLCLLALMQDLSAEHGARQQAQHAQDELAQWFELSGSGMMVYDETGLIVRSNAAFEALVEDVPQVLNDAPAELQALLAWQDGAMSSQLQPGARPLERQALLLTQDGRRRRLSARLACHTSVQADGRVARRVMAVVQDRSAEDERDLAQLERGMLMDTASVGVATYDPTRGWLATPQDARNPGNAAEDGAAGQAPASGALMGIGR